MNLETTAGDSRLPSHLNISPRTFIVRSSHIQAQKLRVQQPGLGRQASTTAGVSNLTIELMQGDAIPRLASNQTLNGASELFLPVSVIGGNLTLTYVLLVYPPKIPWVRTVR